MSQLADAYARAGQPDKAREWYQKAEGDAGQLVGQPAPPFVLQARDGHAIRLADLRGKVVLLHFWGMRYQRSQAQSPHIEALHRKYRAQGLVVLGLSGPNPAAVTLARKSFTYPHLSRAVEISDPYRMRTVPLTVLIDRQGRIAARYPGYLDGDEVALETEVRKLLGAETGSR